MAEGHRGTGGGPAWRGRPGAFRGGPPWHGGRPPWWPENEPWPPSPGAWGGMRRRFMRRVVVFAALVFLLFVAAAGLAAPVVWHAGHRRPVLLGVALLALVAIAAVRGIRGYAGPIADVMDAADRVAEGDYAARVPERGPREMRRLGRAFNAMAERLQTDEDRRRNLMADVTHELRTPLSVIQGTAEGMADGLYATDEPHLTTILDETIVLSRLLDDLQTLSTAEAGVLKLHREAVSPGEIVADAAAAFRAAADEAGVSLAGRTAEGLPDLSVDSVRIAEVFANLLSNALRHTPRGGSITLDARRAEAGGVAITVTDTGAGIPPDEHPHVFERFAKSPNSKGLGLGLAIAKGLIEAHNGTITAESPPSGGTTIRVILPVSD
jgi:two-component system, OmpR family, sensor histidine kinase BaeS